MAEKGTEVEVRGVRSEQLKALCGRCKLDAKWRGKN